MDYVNATTGQLLSYISLLEAERKWQPIKTAPRDGTKILCFRPANPKAIIAKAKRSVIIVDWFDKRASATNFYQEPMESTYTHWMPLPEPPNN